MEACGVDRQETKNLARCSVNVHGKVHGTVLCLAPSFASTVLCHPLHGEENRRASFLASRRARHEGGARILADSASEKQGCRFVESEVCQNVREVQIV